jgi:glucose-1-phosphate cytidylyltransferase
MRTGKCTSWASIHRRGTLKRLKKWLEKDETFLFTYGNGFSDIDVQASIKFHRSHGKLATVTSVLPPARIGRLVFDRDHKIDFKESPMAKKGRSMAASMA